MLLGVAAGAIGAALHPGEVVAPVWAGFALVLAAVDCRFKLDELPWQAHALAGLTLLRSVSVNLYVTDLWHGISLRLVLFEYGLWQAIKQFRFQAYVAFAAAFGRIFFVNLTAGGPGKFWGPRMYTVLPLALIFFLVYAQLAGGEKTTAREGMRLAVVAGYSPYGAVTMFEKFSKLRDEYVIHARSPEQELSQLAIQSLSGYFRSHPQTSERLAQANSMIALEHWEARKSAEAVSGGIRSAEWEVCAVEARGGPALLLARKGLRKKAAAGPFRSLTPSYPLTAGCAPLPGCLRAIVHPAVRPRLC